VRSWNGLAGSDTPRLISLMALAQLLDVVEYRWVAELWLAHKAATTPTPPEVAEALDSSSPEWREWTEKGVNLYVKLRDVETASRVATLRLYTDFRDFRLYCHSCSETSAVDKQRGARMAEVVLESHLSTRWQRLASVFKVVGQDITRPPSLTTAKTLPMHSWDAPSTASRDVDGP